MNIYRDFSEFEPWSDAVSVWERISDEGKLDALEAILEDIYEGGMSETALNDLLRFDSEEVYGWLGMRTYDEICEELSDCYDRLEEIQAEIDDLHCDLCSLGEEDEEERAEIEAEIERLQADYAEVHEEGVDLSKEKENYYQ